MHPRHFPIFFVLLLTDTVSLACANSATRSQTACQVLSKKFPSLVALPGSSQFTADNSHWALSSTQNATCSIEPQNTDDVSQIIQIIGRDDIKAPFAVRGGGHAYNFAFSSTPGVQISMFRFNSVSYDSVQNTATIGTGLTWDQVYEQLQPFNVTIVGGRVPGVGVSGLSLGGGYSWKTDQYGLTVDTIVAYDLVLPSGQMARATNDIEPDLFFALKGGLNNFGIVTSITYETYPQTLVFAGSITYGPNVIDSVNNATATFDLTNTDPKAQAIISYAFVQGQVLVGAVLFYDAPEVPPGIFEVFTAIPSIAQDFKARTFVDFLFATYGANADPGLGGPFIIAGHVVPIVQYTVPILAEMATQVALAGAAVTVQFPGVAMLVTCSAEPFLNPFAHSRGGAYPHPPTRLVTPTETLINFGADSVPGPDTQAALVRIVKQLSAGVQARAVAEGQSRWDDLLYPNYALADTPLELMYGANVPRLNELAVRFDPRGVMQLTGGFKFGETKG